MNDTKKLLRFGTDSPKCEICGTDDFRVLCRRRGTGKSPRAVCRKCLARRKAVSARAATQKARRFQAAGYASPACVVCGEPTLKLLELDHLAGAANADIIEPLCANCHAIKSHAAETGAMAALRLRDPNRSALQLQAAFEFGLAAVLGMFAVWDGARAETARSVFFGVAAGALVAWALWNLAADSHFACMWGPGYDRAVPAAVPR